MKRHLFFVAVLTLLLSCCLAKSVDVESLVKDGQALKVKDNQAAKNGYVEKKRASDMENYLARKKEAAERRKEAERREVERREAAELKAAYDALARSNLRQNVGSSFRSFLKSKESQQQKNRRDAAAFEAFFRAKARKEKADREAAESGWGAAARSGQKKRHQADQIDDNDANLAVVRAEAQAEAAAVAQRAGAALAAQRAEAAAKQAQAAAKAQAASIMEQADSPFRRADADFYARRAAEGDAPAPAAPAEPASPAPSMSEHEVAKIDMINEAAGDPASDEETPSEKIKCYHKLYNETEKKERICDNTDDYCALIYGTYYKGTTRVDYVSQHCNHYVQGSELMEHCIRLKKVIEEDTGAHFKKCNMKLCKKDLCNVPHEFRFRAATLVVIVISIVLVIGCCCVSMMSCTICCAVCCNREGGEEGEEGEENENRKPANENKSKAKKNKANNNSNRNNNSDTGSLKKRRRKVAEERRRLRALHNSNNNLINLNNTRDYNDNNNNSNDEVDDDSVDDLLEMAGKGVQDHGLNSNNNNDAHHDGIKGSVDKDEKKGNDKEEEEVSKEDGLKEDDGKMTDHSSYKS